MFNKNKSTSPVPKKEKLLTFPEAMQAVIDGKKITKKEWGNYAFLAMINNGRLQLQKPNGKFYDWIVNDGDLLGEDWIAFV